MTESHLRPSSEDASMTVVALCGSRDSKRDSLVARNASWHRSRCERTVWLVMSMSWSRHLGGGGKCERGAVLKDKMPRPPSLIGRVIRVWSTANDGAGDAAARILPTELARDASRRSHWCIKSSERRERCKCRRFCWRHCRRTSRACWWGKSTMGRSYTHPTSLDFSRGERRHTIILAQGVREGDPMGPLMFSIGVRSLLRDLASTLGPDQSSWPTSTTSIYSQPQWLGLEQSMLAFFDEQQPPIRLNPAKCNMLTLASGC
jgi:hypothetical protein